MQSKVDWKKIREDFPIFKSNKKLAYLDSTATSQKPECVLEAMDDYYRTTNANVHRGTYAISVRATEMYEEAHRKVAQFIGARNMREVVFTRNATESLNVAAACIGRNLKSGDEIVLTLMEHHSNIVPWQQLQAKGVKLRFVGFDKDGKLNYDELEKAVNDRTRVVSFVHASNVLGTINDAKKICKIAHEAGALAVVDGAQSAPHMPIDVRSMGCDFFAFSGHKMLGPTGAGVLYGREELLEKMEPFLFGGDMIRSVKQASASWNDLPWKFEAGTPDVAAAVGLAAAIDYLQKIGMENVRRKDIEITDYAMKRLHEIKGLQIYGPKDARERTGVVSFNLAGLHPHDIASLLDEEGIAIRAGHACAQPLLEDIGVQAVCRASFYVYNNVEEIDRLYDGLEKAKRILG